MLTFVSDIGSRSLYSMFQPPQILSWMKRLQTVDFYTRVATPTTATQLLFLYFQWLNFRSRKVVCELWAVRPECLIICSKFGHSQQKKFAQQHQNFAKVGAKFCQILTKLSRNRQRLLKFRQNDKISPNLVILTVSKKIFNENVLNCLQLKASERQTKQSCKIRKSIKTFILHSRE